MLQGFISNGLSIYSRYFYLFFIGVREYSVFEGYNNIRNIETIHS